MFEDLQQDGASGQEVEIHLVKCDDSARKRRRPRVQQEDFREWTLEETKRLCELWKNESVLYDHNHPKNHMKEERDKAVKRIAETLSSAEDFISENNITSKMSSLRAYYSGQLSKIKRSKQSEDSEPSYQSHWKFMDDLDFLTKAIVPRNKFVSYTSNNSSVVSSIKSQPSPETSNHFFLEHVEHSNSLDNSAVPSPQRTLTASSVSRHVDESFCSMIQNLLIEIPSGEIKDMLKLKIHQQVIEAKYKSVNSLS